ncbi:hypothetical protein IG631_12702 [Alternaria alternata]|nr:hypothetical protein IG631_12702 [Alternaria alternata]
MRGKPMSYRHTGRKDKESCRSGGCSSLQLQHCDKSSLSYSRCGGCLRSAHVNILSASTEPSKTPV